MLPPVKHKRTHLEDNLQMAVAQYLRYQCQHTHWWHTPNSIKASGDPIKRGRTINRFKQMGMLPGVPDIIIFWTGGRGAIELKVGNNDLTQAQRNFEQQWRHFGGQFSVCRSIDDVEASLRLWGCI